MSLTESPDRTYDGCDGRRAKSQKGGAILGLFRALSIGLFIAALPVALVTANIRVAISEQRVYDYSVRTYSAAEHAGIPASELIRANGEIKRYLTGETPGPLAPSVTDDRGKTVPLFSTREIAHMADVKDLAHAAFSVQSVALAITVLMAVVLLVLWPPRALAAAALYGSLLTAGVIALAAIVALSGFDSAWTEFHILAFSNDLWRLDPNTDHLIQMFPEEFWWDITMLIGSFTLLEALVISGLSAGYLIMTRAQPELVDRAERPRAQEERTRSRLESPRPRHFLR